MREEQDPILQKIQKQESKIIEEVELKKKKKPKNILVICTSMLLFLGILIGLIRILISVAN